MISTEIYFDESISRQRFERNIPYRMVHFKECTYGGEVYFEEVFSTRIYFKENMSTEIYFEENVSTEMYFEENLS